MKHYTINEVFYSLQGEGIRAGTANVFVRFTGCNLKCSREAGPLSPGGFDCDTEFAGGRQLTLSDLVALCRELSPTCENVIFTGGEPGLQVDAELCQGFRQGGFRTLAIETNGTVDLEPLRTNLAGLSWVTLSPKVAEHALRCLYADEVKYVRGYGQALPKPKASATYKLISPAFEGNALDAKTLQWCIQLIKENPEWRLSVQQHKAWAVR